MTQQSAELSPQTVLDELKKNGVTHVVWLPDSETNWLYLLSQEDPPIALSPVGGGGRAFPPAAGRAGGGANPVFLIQNTGLREWGASMRVWTRAMHIRVFLMVGYRGYPRHGDNSDTAATYTEPFLNAYNIKYYLIENNDDAGRITRAFEEADKAQGPVAVLVGDEFHGFNR